MDDVASLSGDYGRMIGELLPAVVDVGSLSYEGWAGMYDISELGPDAVEEHGWAAVIIGMWPSHQIMVEGFKDWNLANWRWLQWEEAFCVTPTPDEHDIIITYDYEIKRWILVGTGLKMKDWEVAERFLRNRILNLEKYADSKVWYLDQIFGNYYEWQLR